MQISINNKTRSKKPKKRQKKYNSARQQFFLQMSLVMKIIILIMMEAMNANLIVNLQNMIQANQRGQCRALVRPKIRKHLESVKTKYHHVFLNTGSRRTDQPYRDCFMQ